MTKNWKKITAVKLLIIFFWSKNVIDVFLGLHAQATGEAFRPQKRTSRTSKHENSLNLFLNLWVIFALLDPEPATHIMWIWIHNPGIKVQTRFCKDNRVANKLLRPRFCNWLTNQRAVNMVRCSLTEIRDNKKHVKTLHSLFFFATHVMSMCTHDASLYFFRSILYVVSWITHSRICPWVIAKT